MTYSAIRLSGAANDGKSVKQTITQDLHGFTAGDVIRFNTGIDGNTAEYVKAQADSAFNAEAIGVVESVVSDSSDFVIVYSGEIDMAEFDITLGQEDVFFLSPDTAGLLDKAPPSSAGEVIKPIVTRLGESGSLGTKGLVTNYIGTSIGGKSTVSLDSVQPIGQIIPWASGANTEVFDAELPNGWKHCNGATLDITEYDQFYKHIRWRSNSDGTVNTPKDGHGFPDPNEGLYAGWGTRFGWQQEIVLETTLEGITTGDWIYQGQGPFDNDNPIPIGITSRVVGQVLNYDNVTKTLTVDVPAVYIGEDDVAGTDETYLNAHMKMFGDWGVTLEGTHHGATIGWIDADNDAGGGVDYNWQKSITSSKITHVKLPDLRGRVPIGADDASPPEGAAVVGRYHMGSYGGKEEHILKTSEMPAHVHEFRNASNNDSILLMDTSTYPGSQFASGAGGYNGINADEAIQPFAGGDAPHTNMQPWLAVNYIIRVSTLAQAALLEDISAIKMHELKDAHIDYETPAGSSFGNMLFYEHDGSTYGWYDHLPLVRNLSPSSNEDLVFYTSQSSGDTGGTEKMRLTQAGQLHLLDGISADGGATFGGKVTVDALHAKTNPIVIQLKWRDIAGVLYCHALGNSDFPGEEYYYGKLNYIQGGNMKYGVYAENDGIRGLEWDQAVSFNLYFPEEERFKVDNYSVQLTWAGGTENGNIVAANNIGADYRFSINFSDIDGGGYYLPFGGPQSGNDSVMITIWTKDV